MQHPAYLIVAAIVFLVVALLSVHHIDDVKKINKAATALDIPREYIPELKYYLLQLYSHYPYIIRYTNEEFKTYVIDKEHHLYHLITRKLEHLMSIHKMIEEDNESHSSIIKTLSMIGSSNQIF